MLERIPAVGLLGGWRFLISSPSPIGHCWTPAGEQVPKGLSLSPVQPPTCVPPRVCPAKGVPCALWLGLSLPTWLQGELKAWALGWGWGGLLRAKPGHLLPGWCAR